MLADAVVELKGLAYASEAPVPGLVGKDVGYVRAHQRRLAISLTFTPWAGLNDAWELTTMPAVDVSKDQIDAATAELNYALKALDRGLLDDGRYISIGDGDKPPLPLSSSVSVRYRLRSWYARRSGRS